MKRKIERGANYTASGDALGSFNGPERLHPYKHSVFACSSGNVLIGAQEHTFSTSKNGFADQEFEQTVRAS